MIAATVERFGTVDVLVNNSGGPALGSFWDFSDDDWRQAFEVTTLNFVRFVREVVPLMRERRWGRIVGIAAADLNVLPAWCGPLTTAIRRADIDEPLMVLGAHQGFIVVRVVSQ